MKRRTFVRTTGGSLLLATLTGCLEAELEAAEHEPRFLQDLVRPEEIDLPVRQRLGVAETAIERARDVPIETIDELIVYLEEQNQSLVDGRTVEEDGEPIDEFTFIARTFDRRGFMHHLGLVAGGFARLVESSHGSHRLHAILLDVEERQFGEYEIRTEVAMAFNEGSLTAREYANEVSISVTTST